MPAASASFRSFAGDCKAVSSATSCARPSASSRRACKSFSSSRKIPAPMASISATPNRNGAENSAKLGSSTSLKRSAHSVSGCGLHYIYPYPHVDKVLPLMADGRVLPYLDIPFQHASPSVLKSMRRPAHQEKTLQRIQRWREMCPDLAIRSTFIVGFPGETEQDFTFLLDWLSEAQAQSRRLLQI